MTVIEFIQKNRFLNYKLSIEFRENNNFIKVEIIDDIYYLSDNISKKEIKDWFIDYDKQIIIINIY